MFNEIKAKETHEEIYNNWIEQVKEDMIKHGTLNYGWVYYFNKTDTKLGVELDRFATFTKPDYKEHTLETIAKISVKENFLCFNNTELGKEIYKQIMTTGCVDWKTLEENHV